MFPAIARPIDINNKQYHVFYYIWNEESNISACFIIEKIELEGPDWYNEPGWTEPPTHWVFHLRIWLPTHSWTTTYWRKIPTSLDGRESI